MSVVSIPYRSILPSTAVARATMLVFTGSGTGSMASVVNPAAGPSAFVLVYDTQKTSSVEEIVD